MTTVKVLRDIGLAAVICLLLLIGASLVSCFSSPAPPPPPPNHAPRIISLTAERSEVPVLGNVRINCLVADADGDSLSYNWSASGGTVEGTGSEVLWVAPEAPASYTVTVVVLDGNGGRASRSLTLTAFVRPNNLPRIVSLTIDGAPPRDVNSSRAYATHTLKCVAEDPDGDTLRYIWSCTGGKITGQGGEVGWTAPGVSDDYTVTVLVSDGRGGTATETLRFSVSCCGR